MKNIQDILKRKARREKSGVKKELDEKTIGPGFFGSGQRGNQKS